MSHVPHESERIEQSAWAGLVTAVRPFEADRAGLSVRWLGHGSVSLSAAGADHLLLNRVIGFGPDPGGEAAAEVAAHYARQGIRRYMVQASPPDVAAAGEALARFGIVLYPRGWVKLARPSGPVEPVRSVVEVRALDRAPSAALAEIFCAAFAMPEVCAPLWTGAPMLPHWYGFLAYDGARPIGAAALYIEGDVAYLAGGATLPSHRGRGAQSALIARRLEVAFDLGCRVAYSETGVAMPGEANTSEHNLLRAGFVRTYVRENFVPQGVSFRGG